MASGSGAFIGGGLLGGGRWRAAASVGVGARQVSFLLCPSEAMLGATIFLPTCHVRRTNAAREAVKAGKARLAPPATPTPTSRTAPRSTATTSRSWRELQADARLSNAELAARIGLSAAPTWRRVKWLEQQGYITGYRAEIDRRKIGLGVLAFVRVDAERNTGGATRALEDAIRAPARGRRLPLHQRRRHLRAAGDGDRPRRLLALGRSRRCSSCPT